jgi:RHS repeat-associated protein
VTIQGKPAQTGSGDSFRGRVPVGSGTTSISVVARDASGNTTTNTYEVDVTGATTALSYNADGALVDDGTRTFEWDAEGRLVAVNGGTHRSEFTYDGKHRRVKIVEKDNGSVTSTRTFVWCDGSICEERDATGSTVTRRFFRQGMQVGGTAYFYTSDHLGSIREMTDGAGAVRARYDYDPYGRMDKVSGDLDSAFGYTGHLVHSESGLTLAWRRAYEPDLGRWINEDPIGLEAGINLYAYVLGDPINATDPTGLDLYKCSRQSNGVLAFTNHVYFCDPSTHRNCGKGSQSGFSGRTNIPHGGPCEIPPPPGVVCVLIPDTSSSKVTNGVLDCCKALGRTYGNDGFLPFADDCHTYAARCLTQWNLSNPSTPGGRIGCRDCGGEGGCPSGMVPFKDGCRPK